MPRSIVAHGTLRGVRTVAAVATAIIPIALFLVLLAEKRGNQRGVHTFKPIASLAFVVAGSALAYAAPSRFAAFIVTGLLFAAAGDVALMYRTERTFRVGLVLFLVGHLWYVAAALTRAPATSWLAWRALVPIVASTAAFVWLRPHLGRMRVPVTAYVLVITTMVIAALAIPEPHWRFVVGAVLFYLSDLTVARQRFVVQSFANRVIGLPLYYAGQALLAWSLYS